MSDRTMVLENLRLEVGDDGVAVVFIDVRGERVNVLTPRLGEDFEAVIERLETDPAIRAVVVASGKPEGFVAGADLKMMRDLTDAAEVSRLGHATQGLFGRIEALHRAHGKPVVAAIHGAVMGGGTELALACGMRILSDSPRTVVSCPEVKVGMLPAAGGCTRLPRLIGIAAALDLVLTGRDVRAKAAKKLGFADEVVPEPVLLDVARRRALEALAPKPARKRGPGPLLDALRRSANPKELQRLLLETNPVGRAVLFHQARKAMLAKTRGNYPAAEAILETVRTGVEKGPEAGFAAETAAFGRLATSSQAKALMGLFFDLQDLKKDDGVDGAAQARPVRRVGILGGGLMGGGIAVMTVGRAGVPARIKELDGKGVARALKYVGGVLGKWAKRGRVTRQQADRLMRQVTATTDLSGFGALDLVIEAVFEDLELKQGMLRDVEAVARVDTVFASNTSSLPISRIAGASSHPETVIGMHYFSPVEKMPLLEVIVTDRTADWVTATCVAFGKAQGKTVIVVRDGPGFYTTRILAPYLNEAARILAEGAPIEQVDGALVDRGFPVGPIVLMDEVGIDVGEKVSHVLFEALGERFQPPAAMAAVVADGRKGRKNGRGFYRYEKGKKQGPDASIYALAGVKPDAGKFAGADLADRVLLAMVNEAALCLQEGILRSARDGDVGAIFGLGFPPFEGGPFRFIDRVGAAEIVRRLDALAAVHGPRFEPAKILRKYAKSGMKFRA